MADAANKNGFGVLRVKVCRTRRVDVKSGCARRATLNSDAAECVSGGSRSPRTIAMGGADMSDEQRARTERVEDADALITLLRISSTTPIVFVS
jgi:hypothetical protein